ncbi:ABC transporter, transmembrane domain, type 1 [Metarhizium album ARSEF 1941]|uniref:ABC transporter, transmembrane domain, type 1 n=1 Tax=Metarhizium album (strain ARSEF 1941) TaxID=1081103 RepID=A0A0B2WJH1_METAS|nr:ABC transporter, transmembrane domain, type 1 [Metarhizium album ARSEF 1941]KHN96181.1 ABC transporter, transmembrane domain, type 1 [Metarhizium album ARSEF 1941]
MASVDGKTFPPRKWYRRVPFLSQKPIETRLTQRHVDSKPAFSSSRAENGEGTDSHAHETETPESRADLLSVITFNWLGTLLRTGYSRPLQTDDLYDLPSTRLVIDHARRLEESWAARRAANKQRRLPARWLSWIHCWTRRTTDATILTLSLNDICFRWFWSGGLLKMLGDLTQMVSPLLIRFLINSLNDPSRQAYRSGFGFAVGLFAVLALSIVSNVHGFYRSASTGLLLRAALMHVIYRRSTTQLTERARLKDDLGAGKLMSLMSADVTRVDFCCSYLHSAWTSILQIILCLGLAIWTLGYSALPGFGLLALLYPLQSLMMNNLFRLRRHSMPFTDARVKAVVEAVSAIRLVKTNAYEKSLLSKIGKLRSDEVVYIRKRMLLRALNIAVSFTAPTLASVVSIVCYGVVTGSDMQAGVVFSGLAFFLLMRAPLGALPIAISAIADARAALERLSMFMVASDEAAACDAALRKELAQKSREAGSGCVIEVEDAVFAYHDDEQFLADDSDSDSVIGEKPPAVPSQRLYIDSLKVRKHQLVAIVGPVASGKSSVFRALLGDMHLVEALSCSINLDLSVARQLALAPQVAWLLSETVRENIVFGRPFDAGWYDEVLRRCCLHQDLHMLSDGDMTVVGEKGVSLSGGQKQRISLARAVYGQSQLLLLDDCFSALDAHVGARVFDSVVNQARRNNECTIVFITHSMALARQADHIVYMDKGRTVEQGSFDHLDSLRGPFHDYIGSSMAQDSSLHQSPETKQPADADRNAEVPPEGEDEASHAKPPDKNNEEEKATSAPTGSKKPGTLEERGKEIMQHEERLIGTVSGKTYLRYMGLGNAWLTVPLLLAAIAMFQGTSVVSPLWLSWWQTNKFPSISESAYMGGFAALGIGQSLGLFLTSSVFAIFCFWCSNQLHAAALSGVLFAPMAFFDTTPQGRITHRFSKDMDAVDNVVGEQLRIFISTLVQVMGTIIVVSIILPVFLAIAGGVLLMYIWTGMYYRPSSRELRRLNNLLRSRVYEHFGESLSGLPTLKAFGVVERFVDDNAAKIDTENKAYWLSIAAMRWLNLRLDLSGAILVLGVGLLVVGLRDTIDASSGGAVLSYMVTAQAAFGNMIRFSAEIESNMNSVERMLHYAYGIQQEPAHDVKSVDKRLKEQEWPRKGHVRFQSVTLSHRPGLDPALRGVTLDVGPGEKIGIVGRTGAGKTTLITSLLRLCEPTNGRIIIDGTDIHTVGLHLLRSRLSVISQDAVLLAGTIRYNLDPFQQYDDVWLAKCLRTVGLGGEQSDTKAIKSTGGVVSESSDTGKKRIHDGSILDLDFEVKENGANVSHGQRSLISIARALVRRSRVVILDEATASIDGRADKQLQAMLTEIMADATVFTVAHRLETIIDSCDRVLVMDRGRVAEFDSAPNLYARPDGLFRALCDAAKMTVAEEKS